MGHPQQADARKTRSPGDLVVGRAVGHRAVQCHGAHHRQLRARRPAISAAWRGCAGGLDFDDYGLRAAGLAGLGPGTTLGLGIPGWICHVSRRASLADGTGCRRSLERVGADVGRAAHAQRRSQLNVGQWLAIGG